MEGKPFMMMKENTNPSMPAVTCDDVVENPSVTPSQIQDNITAYDVAAKIAIEEEENEKTFGLQGNEESPMLSPQVKYDQDDGDAATGTSLLKTEADNNHVTEDATDISTKQDNTKDEEQQKSNCVPEKIANENSNGRCVIVAASEEDSVAAGLSPSLAKTLDPSAAAAVVVCLEDEERNVTSTQQQEQAQEVEEPLSIISLPNDSLHSIASFLSPVEWANFGLCDKKTNAICLNVFRRVRMHGFRCATEVITAWKLEQHADARELCALYVRAGVPIYPHCLGHSYHTLLWRMGVEAKELREQRRQSKISEASANQNTQNSTAQNVDNNESNTEDAEDDGLAFAVDPFFHEREETRSANDFASTGRLTGNSSTYLEEKARYILKSQEDESDVDQIANRLRRQMSLRNPPRVPNPPAEEGNDRHAPSIPPAPRAPSRWNSMVVARGENTSRPQLARANSFSEFRFRKPKASMKIHRHLLDQHLLGKAAVNDIGGKMLTPIVSLSADFFHPHFKFNVNHNGFSQSNSARHNNSLRTSPTSSTTAGMILDRIETPLLSNPSGSVHGDRNALSAENAHPGHSPSRQDTESDQEDNVIRPRPVVMEPETDREEEIDRLLAHPTFPSPFGVSEGSSRQGGQDVLNQVDLKVYSASTTNSSNEEDNSEQELMLSHLKSRYATYQRRLEKSLLTNDSDSFEEFMLDFWDEFLPQTAMIQYYDQHTAVPRLSCLQKFLTRPCPKAIGIVQCEIERIKVGPKKKGVNMKGRFFPTYEYRLFIRDRRVDAERENEGDDTQDDESTSRRDTVLMMAKNRGRHSGKAPPAFSSKKGSNNYYLYLPHQEDVSMHYKGVNDRDCTRSPAPNGAGKAGSDSDASSLLCRLQSNFIGTEFQIFTPRNVPLKPKPLTKRSLTAPHSANYAVASDDEDPIFDEGADLRASLTPRRSRFSRLSLRGFNGSGTGDGESSPSQDPSHYPPLPLRRTRSSGDVAPSRKSRLSRRVSAADAFEAKLYSSGAQSACFEEEDGAITYTANLLGSRPRIMDVCIPKVDLDGVGTEWKRYLEYSEEMDASAGVSSNRMLNRLKQLQQRGDTDDWVIPNNNNNSVARNNNNQSNHRDGRVRDEPTEYVPPDDYGLLALQNRPPWWNVELGSFVLNFGGRVSVASVKNFQLCDRSDQDYIMLQFGRIQGRHNFTMDFQYPLTGVQAFAIAISSLQSKISFG